VSATATFWVVILVLAVGTWAMRSLPIMLHGHVTLPAWAERLLRYVPVAALTAIAVPGALYLKSAGVYHVEPPRILAGLAAMLVALRTRNVVATLVAGMGVLWVAQTLLPRLGF
jgi:branched-subunit amino acid transport protein